MFTKGGILTFIELFLKHQLSSISQQIKPIITALIAHVEAALRAKVYIPPCSDGEIFDYLTQSILSGIVLVWSRDFLHFQDKLIKLGRLDPCHYVISCSQTVNGVP